MHFKLEHILNEIDIRFKDQMPLVVNGEGSISAQIRPLTADEKENRKEGELLCVATVQEEPAKGILEIFEQLVAGKMPQGFKKPNAKPSQFETETFFYVDDAGRLTSEYLPPASWFSKDFQEFEAHLNHKLTNFIRRSVKIIRWRKGLKSAHKPVRATLGLSWSFNGQDWYKMPTGLISLSTSIELVFSWSSNHQAEIESLIADEANEPLGHELFLEAWQNKSASPRSALIVGIAAAEVGLKECIGKLVPYAQWLVGNMPSPPLDKMISRYLPLLPAKLKIKDAVIKPPKAILTALSRGIEMRNKTTHAGNAAPKEEELKELLLSVRDLLYLLDYYCGSAWALENIRHETYQAMLKEFASTTPAKTGSAA